MMTSYDFSYGKKHYPSGLSLYLVKRSMMCIDDLSGKDIILVYHISSIVL